MSLSQRIWKFDAIDKKECPRQLGKDVPVNKQVLMLLLFSCFLLLASLPNGYGPLDFHSGMSELLNK